MKKFILSAIALIGMTVTSYGANYVEQFPIEKVIVEKVEMNENLLFGELQVVVAGPICSGCQCVFLNRFILALHSQEFSMEECLEIAQHIYEFCIDDSLWN